MQCSLVEEGTVGDGPVDDIPLHRVSVAEGPVDDISIDEGPVEQSLFPVVQELEVPKVGGKTEVGGEERG